MTTKRQSPPSGSKDMPSPDADRREVVIGAAAIAAGFGALGPGAAEAADKPDRMDVQAGDRFEFIKGPYKGELATLDLLETGEKPTECFPLDPASGVLRRRNRLNRALVLRLDPAEMDEETRARSAEGALVFSAICTHKGCTIKSWMAKERYLRCHCHLSEFAALEQGGVREGPAQYELPMVPLAIDGEGYLVATAGFTSKPGGKTK